MLIQSSDLTRWTSCLHGSTLECSWIQQEHKVWDNLFISLPGALTRVRLHLACSWEHTSKLPGSADCRVYSVHPNAVSTSTCSKWTVEKNGSHFV